MPVQFQMKQFIALMREALVEGDLDEEDEQAKE